MTALLLLTAALSALLGLGLSALALVVVQSSRAAASELDILLAREGGITPWVRP